MPDVWFAAMDRDFIPIYYHRKFSKIELDEFYLVETEYLKNKNQVYTPLVNYFQENFDCQPIKSIPAYHGEVVRICACSNPGNRTIPTISKSEYPGWRTAVNKSLDYKLFTGSLPGK